MAAADFGFGVPLARRGLPLFACAFFLVVLAVCVEWDEPGVTVGQDDGSGSSRSPRPLALDPTHPDFSATPTEASEGGGQVVAASDPREPEGDIQSRQVAGPRPLDALRQQLDANEWVLRVVGVRDRYCLMAPKLAKKAADSPDLQREFGVLLAAPWYQECIAARDPVFQVR